MSYLSETSCSEGGSQNGCPMRIMVVVDVDMDEGTGTGYSWSAPR